MSGHDIELARFARGHRGDVVIALRSYKGKLYIDMRAWMHTPSGESTPTAKGVTIRIAEIPKLIAALGRARDLIERGVE